MKKEGLIKVIIFLVVIIIVLAVLIVYILNNKKEETTNTNVIDNAESITNENISENNEIDINDSNQTNTSEDFNYTSSDTNIVNNNEDNDINTVNSDVSNLDNLDDDKVEELIKKEIIEIAKQESELENSSQKYAEAHTIFGKDNKDNVAYYTVLTTYGIYEKNKNKINTITETSMPMLIGINSEYEVVSCEMPKDGEDYAESVRKIFPDDIEEQILNNELEIENVQSQLNEYFE